MLKSTMTVTDAKVVTENYLVDNVTQADKEN